MDVFVAALALLVCLVLLWGIGTAVIYGILLVRWRLYARRSRRR